MVEIDFPLLPIDPIITQIKNHRKATRRRFKAKTCNHLAISKAILTRIMVCDNAKQIWDALREEFQGNDKIKQMKVFNLIRKFELLRMKETKIIKEYSKRILNVVNKIKLMGKELLDKRAVEKVLMSLPNKLEQNFFS